MPVTCLNDPIHNSDDVDNGNRSKTGTEMGQLRPTWTDQFLGRSLQDASYRLSPGTRADSVEGQSIM